MHDLMILAFDSFYFQNKARTVCIAFEHWGQTINYKLYSEIREGVADYQPGAFYRRELPCILSLLKTIPVENIEAIIVDGFVFLDDEGRLGLGGHLYEALGGKIPVIGLAKTDFAPIEKRKRTLLRGGSKRPVYITAIGMDVEVAAEHIKSMSGPYRLPTLLKHLDRLTREE